MDTVQLSTQIRRLIAEGELETAARTLLQYLDQEGLSSADKARFQVYNQALYQVAQLNELQDQVIRGIISTEDADLKRNRIREALLEISEGLGSLEVVTTLQKSHLPTVPLPKPKHNLTQIIGILFILTLLIWALIKISINNPPPNPDSPPKVIPDNERLEDPDVVIIPPPTICGTIKTGFHNRLQKHPEVVEDGFMDLPNFREFEVLEVKKIDWAGSTIYFFRIKHEQYEGWVRNFGLNSISPDCLD